MRFCNRLGLIASSADCQTIGQGVCHTGMGALQRGGATARNTHPVVSSDRRTASETATHWRGHAGVGAAGGAARGGGAAGSSQESMLRTLKQGTAWKTRVTVGVVMQARELQAALRGEGRTAECPEPFSKKGSAWRITLSGVFAGAGAAGGAAGGGGTAGGLHPGAHPGRRLRHLRRPQAAGAQGSPGPLRAAAPCLYPNYVSQARGLYGSALQQLRALAASEHVKGSAVRMHCCKVAHRNAHCCLVTHSS